MCTWEVCKSLLNILGLHKIVVNHENHTHLFCIDTVNEYRFIFAENTCSWSLILCITSLAGLMPYNFICVQTGGMLSQISSVDDIFTSATLIKLGVIALVALVPGMIVQKLKNKKLKSVWWRMIFQTVFRVYFFFVKLSQLFQVGSYVLEKKSIRQHSI